MIVVPVYLYQVILEKVPVWEYDLSVLIIVNIQPFFIVPVSKINLYFTFHGLVGALIIVIPIREKLETSFRELVQSSCVLCLKNIH